MSAACEPFGETLPTTPAPPAARPPEDRPLLDPAIQTILDQAQARRLQYVQALCAHHNAQARLQRAQDAWHAVASYRGDAIPRGLTSAQRQRAYAERILALGRVLVADGWRERLDAVTPGTDAKTYAVAMLRKAKDGDLAAVERMVHEAIDTLEQLGLAADGWLREGLMYEVLGIQPPPEPPPGWEGLYSKPVETVADLVAWIERQFVIQQVIGKGRGDQSSDGRLVRDAFRLVSHLGLTGLPEEPLGPWILNDELAVLRNLLRHCRPLLGATASNDSSPSPSSSSEEQEESVVAGEVSAGAAGGATAEELVRRFLADHGTASMEEVTTATGLSDRKVLRTQAWKDHVDRRVDSYLQQHPEANTGDVQNALGFSRSKVVTLRAWKDHQARRDAARSSRRVQNRERPLTAAMVDCRADESAEDPGGRMTRREQIYRAILEKADRTTRARLNGLRAADRDALVDHLLGIVDDGGLKGRKPADIVVILVEVAQSWLEEREQRGRPTRHREKC